MKKILMGFSGLGALHYLWIKDQHYHFQYVKTKKNKKIEESLIPIFDDYIATSLLVAKPLIQNIYIGKIHSEEFDYHDYERELLRMEDGGQISLDWGKDTRIHKVTNSRKKTVIIIHGLTGGSNSGYCKNVVKEALKKGYTPVVVHNRGYNKTPLLTLMISSPMNSLCQSDLRIAYDHIKDKFPENDIYMIGFSIGANQMLRFLNEHQTSMNELKAVVSISTAFDVNDASDRLGHGVVEEFFVKKFLSNYFKPNEEFILKKQTDVGYSYEKMKKSRTLRELHQEYTCRVLGLENTHEMFNLWHLDKSHLEGLDMPVLFLHSHDDDLCPSGFIPKEVFDRKDNLFYAETKHGGHVGWFAGYFPPKMWFSRPVFEYLSHFD